MRVISFIHFLLDQPSLLLASEKGEAAPECLLTFFPHLLNVYSLQEILGGNAVSDEYAIGRHVANLFVTQTYEGQSDIHSQFFFFNIPHLHMYFILCVYVVVENLR